MSVATPGSEPGEASFLETFLAAIGFQALADGDLGLFAQAKQKLSAIMAEVRTEILSPSAQRRQRMQAEVLVNRAADRMPIIRQVQLIGGAMITIAIIGIVLNEFLTLDAVANSTGPMQGVFDSLETTGVAAMTLLVIGLLVVAANGIMRFFGGGF